MELKDAMIGILRRCAKVVLRPLKPIIYQEFDRHVQQTTGLLPIEQSDPEDIFIAGYPKSGNTWLQHLVAGLVFGMDMRLAPDSVVQELVPDVHYSRFYRRHPPLTFFKTHELPRPEYRRVIYLLRDGRDVMVSYFHYLNALSGAPPHFQNLVATGEGLFPCRWCEHVEAWLANPYNSQMIIISYEALKGDPVTELRKLCAFAGLERNQACLETAAQTCTFEVMREKEKKFGWGGGADWPKDKSFVRRGAVGSFRDEMPRETLEVFIRQSEAALKLAGYAVDRS